MMKDILLKLMFDILKKYIDFAMIYPFCLEGQKLKKLKNLQPTCMIKRMWYKHKFKTNSNRRLVLKVVHRVIKFNQEAWLKP